ncbi:brefeldin A-inhibited guanine nucleotide-exchange protein 1 [Gossypium australe]|uniref:Brefeldin A-inhibited guanine nucleotide-exchange protein 1 n=1 Tax=Gossypium australe TaxID=47621 RepID=A0A5B6V217_9ROSI|nr:brefeldin A-inhibited guanine nucleotide-exchange protein 1 [Gossypium australe]
MSAPQTLGGPSRCGRVLGPSLDKIVKNAAWRKHSHIVSSCKSALDKLDTLSDSALSDPSSPLLGLSSSDADFVLNPILLALDSNYAKLADPALESLFKLFSLGLVRGEIESNIPNSILYKIVQSVCKVGGIGDESIELAVLRVLLSAVRCPCVLIRGDCLLHVIRTCYNVYLSALNGTNQVCAKSVLAQIVLIVFTRAEEDSMDVSTKTVPVSELLEFTDKNLNEGSSVYYCQNFVSEVVNASEGVPDLKFSQPITGPELQNGESKVSNGEEKDGVEEEETKEGVESSSDGVTSKIREDGFLVFKYLCKLSMKFSSQENPDDEILLRGKTVSLELLKVIMNNGDSIWHTNERQVTILCSRFLFANSTRTHVQDLNVGHHLGFLNAIKQYLCLSLLKNSALSVMSIFQLLCSIFMSLITKYRSGIVNGLLKTALGPPSGSTTTLSAVQDVTFRHESVKCLVGIIKSMGAWMDGQLKIGHSDSPKSFENDTSAESHSTSTAEDGTLADCEFHPEMNSELSDAATVEQRRAYKIELLMTKSDFIRNNRGINDGKDLPEEYLGALYDQIVKNEIKMNADSSVPQSKQENSLNKLLGLDGILNLVSWKQTEDKPLGANGLLIRHIQEQFKAKSGKSESVYHVVSDVSILRFMVEVCWGPMLAAFSVTLDQSDDRLATTHCLLGFRHAVHVTAVLGMQTQRDAFVTSVAKFTFLHCAADMKQKNVDAVKVSSICSHMVKKKWNLTPGILICYITGRVIVAVSANPNAIISIAIEDGNHLQEAWEHILTCLSRIEHLQLLGEGAPTDASFLSVSNTETDDKMVKSAGLQSLKNKGTLQNLAVMAVVRGGSYDSASVGVNNSGLVSPEQINHFIANLNLLEQIGSFELNHVFAHSQRLNSEAIVAFVKALCKVSISELQSPTDPRVFSLTKLVEIAHYNMNRIRLVWSRMWNVLSDFFVSVGLSENLSVAIFVMDSLRQLAMKFLEREELANYNFQNEFLRPFVIIMWKSNSTEIRELIVRCISQMVLSRVRNVKSGWKSVFSVFTAAAADEHKNVVLLAFETMEKIVREYFPYITETEAATFTDCVRCLIRFTNSRFNSDVSLNAIAFLRFCAFKLAEGGLVCTDKSSGSSVSTVIKDDSGVQSFRDIDDPGSYWGPLLTGLSKLTSDSRLAIRKSSLEVLFNILNDHGHLFSETFWLGVFSSVVLPIFDGVCEKRDKALQIEQDSPTAESPHRDAITWDTETSAVALQCIVDLFISFYDVLRPQLSDVVCILTRYLRSSIQGPASTGVAALSRLTGELGSRLSEDEWQEILLALKEAAMSTLPGFKKLLTTMDDIKVPHNSQSYSNTETSSDHGLTNDDLEGDNLQNVAYVVSRMKSHISVQLLILEVVTDMYRTHLQFLSAANINIIVEIFSSISSHALQLNSETTMQKKIQIACSILELSEPPMLHFEKEAYQNYLDFLQYLVKKNLSISKEMNLELLLVAVCEKIMQIYLNCTTVNHNVQQKSGDKVVVVAHWTLPLSSAMKEELAARTPLLLSALRALSGLERDSFRKYISNVFLLLVDLVRSEHSSGEVQRVLSNIFQSCIGTIIMQ